MRVLTDSEIAALLADEKPLPEGWMGKLKPKAKQGKAHLQRQLTVTSSGGHLFELILRSSTLNPLDFSVILAYVEPSTNHHYLLIRHNGKHPSYHSNKIEKQQGLADYRFKDRFHIHRATERYQIAGLSIVGFAEPTSAYDSLDKAVDYMVSNYGFTTPQPEAPLYTQQGDE